MNERCKDLKTPLHLIAKGGPRYLEHLNLLLRAGARSDTQDRQGNTPLHIATQERQVAILSALLTTISDPKRDLKVRNHHEKTPVDLATSLNVI